MATIELGTQVYDQFSKQTGRKSTNVLVYRLPGSNAIEMADGVRAARERMKDSFPPDLEYHIPFDTTRFVNAAIHEVYRTLIEAGVLVLGIVFDAIVIGENAAPCIGKHPVVLVA